MNKIIIFVVINILFLTTAVMGQHYRQKQSFLGKPQLCFEAGSGGSVFLPIDYLGYVGAGVQIKPFSVSSGVLFASKREKLKPLELKREGYNFEAIFVKFELEVYSLLLSKGYESNFEIRPFYSVGFGNRKRIKEGVEDNRLFYLYSPGLKIGYNWGLVSAFGLFQQIDFGDHEMAIYIGGNVSFVIPLYKNKTKKKWKRRY